MPAEHLARHRIRGGEFLGLDPACLAAIDVPEARRLAGFRTWGVTSVGLAGTAGLALAWLSNALWLAPLISAGIALFVWNLLRLISGFGAPTHREESAVATWRPGRGAFGVLFVLGAVLAQPTLALIMGFADPIDLAAHRATLVAEVERAVATPFDAALAELDARGGAGSADAGPSDGGSAPVTATTLAWLTERRAALTAARAEALATEVPPIRARIEASPMFATSVALAWGAPFGPIFTFFHALLVASPALARLAAPRALRQYERVRVRTERAAVAAAWTGSEARVIALLNRWPTFSGVLRPVSTDPPFDDRPLLLGFARGTVVPTNLAELRAHLPGYDAACTAGGRRRAAERERLTRQLALAEATPTAPGRYHLATTLVTRARLLLDTETDVAAADAQRAVGLYTDLIAELGEKPSLLAGRIRASLLVDAATPDGPGSPAPPDPREVHAPVDAALTDAEALLRHDPRHVTARRLMAAALDAKAARDPTRRQELCREALTFATGTPDEGLARRNLARALLPKGGPEASALAEAGYLAAKDSGDPVAIAAALDLVSTTNPARAPACRPEAVALLTRVWADDPTDRHAIDLACLLGAAAAYTPDPPAARLLTTRALALVADVDRPHARTVHAEVKDLGRPPLLVERMY